jgi:phosphonate transport system ATP-binding protein
MTTLRRLAVEEGLGVVVVLHQPDLATRYAHRIVGMRAGRVAFDTPAAATDPAAVAALYRGEPVAVGAAG